MIRKATNIVASIIALCVLSSCTNLSLPDTRPFDVTTPEIQHAETLLEAGKNQAAAAIFWDIAAKKTSPQREVLQLRAVEAVLQPPTELQARQYLNAIDEQGLTQDLLIRKRVATAELEMIRGQPQRALEAIPAKFIELSQKYQPRILEIRAQALQDDKQIRASIETRIALDALLENPDQLYRNRQLIWQSLSELSTEVISAWENSNTNPQLSAWLSLASIQKHPHETLHSLENRLQQWRHQYPQHGVPNHIIESIAKEWTSFRLSPVRVALLLPMTGRYSSVANAIYAGVITAHEFGESFNPSPEIILYDTGSNPVRARNYYDQAVNEGADFIIGPLQKEAVNTLARRTQLPVPSLLLNYTNITSMTTDLQNMFQFGLLPEDEAVQVAERALLDGHITALALVSDGDWGRRLLEAFTSRFFELGGVVLQSEYYISAQADYSTKIKKLLRLDQSEQRHRNIQSIIKQKTRFKPERRRDADFIFIAASPQQARLLRPQLSYHYASDLPVYATSHIFSGKENISADQDINGVIYCDIPWLLSTDPTIELLRDSSNLKLSGGQSYLPRFAALGVDAYQIIPHLRRLAAYQHDRYNGMTGKISIDEHNRIYRELIWAKFKDGHPQKLDSENPVAFQPASSWRQAKQRPIRRAQGLSIPATTRTDTGRKKLSLRQWRD